MSSSAAPVSTTTSIQLEASSSSSVSPSESQSQSRCHPMTFVPHQSGVVSSSLISQPQTNQCIYPSVSSQSAAISSSSFLPQSQTNQPAHTATSFQPLTLSSSLFLSQTTESVLNSLTQPLNVTPSPFSFQSRTNQPTFYATPSTSFISHSQSTPLSAHNSMPSTFSLNHTPRPSSAYPAIPPSETCTVEWRPCPRPAWASTSNQPTYDFASIAQNNSSLSHSTSGTSFPPPTQINPPAYPQTKPPSLEKRLFDVSQRWLLGHQTSGIFLANQPTTSTSSSRPSASPNVTITPRSTLVQFPNQNSVSSIQNTSSTDNVSSSNRDLHLAPTSAQQNSTNATKEWQRPFNQELREYLVKRLVQSMFPTTTLTTPSMTSAAQNCRSYIEKMEREIYEAANSKGEYYHLMAEKHYKIHTELDKKRQARKAQAQQLQQQKQQQLQSQNSQQDVEMASLQTSDETVSNQSSDTISGTSAASSLMNSLLTNKQKTFTKEWHKQIGTELREILVKEFVQKVRPVPGSETVINNPEEFPANIDECIKSHVKNVECDIYQKADSRIEYYELLADRFCKIQEELRKGNFGVLETS